MAELAVDHTLVTLHMILYRLDEELRSLSEQNGKLNSL